MKKLYISAWFLLAAAVIVSAFGGVVDGPVLLVFSLVALGLVYALALWSIVVNAREPETKRFEGCGADFDFLGR